MGLRLIGSSDSRDYGDDNVIKHFSSDNSDNKNITIIDGQPFTRVGSTPDPSKFEILNQKTVNGYPILMVRYPDVSNYEGKKILMYGKNFDLNNIKYRIDPHFFTEGDSPIARFEPTQYGIKLAIILAENLE